MSGYTVWESGDALGVHVSAPRDGVMVGFALTIALFCLAVLVLMYFIVVQSEQALPHVDRVVASCALLLVGDLGALAWLFRQQVLVVQPRSISLGTRIAGLGPTVTLPRDGTETVRAETDGRLSVSSGGRSVVLVGLAPGQAPRVAARVDSALHSGEPREAPALEVAQ